MCLGTLSALTSCLEEDSGGHEHDFSAAWISDENQHWKLCKGEDCNRTSDVSTHSFAENMDDPENPAIKCTVCGYIKAVDPHSHEFSEGYLSNATNHWHRCTEMGCNHKNDVIEHVYGNPEVKFANNRYFVTERCVDCGYSKVISDEISTTIQNEEEWRYAFNSLKLENLTNYSGKQTTESKDKKEYYENSVFIANDAAYYCDAGILEYYTVNNGGVFTTYYRGGEKYKSDDPFIMRSNQSNLNYEEAKKGTYMHGDFENNFELFEYDYQNGEYVCNQDIRAEIYEKGKLSDKEVYCYDITVRIKNGEVNYISMKYYFKDQGKSAYTRTLVYYNIGMTSVKVPAEVINPTTK